VALALAGCGGSDREGPRLTHDAFARSMESICRTQNVRLQGVHRGDPASDRRWVQAARDALKRIERLNPPKRDEERLRDAFAHWSKGVDDLEDFVHALETNKAREGNEAFHAMAAEVRAIDRLIPDYPAQACWGPT
jgi:hypothetical protein